MIVHPTSSADLEKVQVLTAICPVCDQAIPNERLEAVQAKHADHERQIEARVVQASQAELARQAQQHEVEKRELAAKLELKAASRENAARLAERTATMARVEERLSAAAAATQAANTEKAAALAANAQAEAGLKKLEAEKNAAINKLESEMAGREAAARAAERTAVTAEASEKLAEAAKAQQEAESKAADLTKRLIAQAEETTKQLEQARKEAIAGLEPQLLAARTTAQTADSEKQAAIAAKTAAEEQLQATKDGQAKLVTQTVQETREAMEKANLAAMGALEAKHFEDTQKVRTQLAETQRQLERKTAQELGEGAEVDLYEALRTAFPNDDITRVPKGTAGADIKHRVRHNGHDCGLILYDSKNRRAWQNEFVTKLRDDQLAGKAEFAILTTSVFPEGCKQVTVRENIIVLNPARAVEIARIVRQHVVRSHTLRLSHQDRDDKSSQLYDFITSERFETHSAKVRSSMTKLDELEAAEKTAHDRVWAKRGQLHGALSKCEADLRAQIESIVGVSEECKDEESDVEASHAVDATSVS